MRVRALRFGLYADEEGQAWVRGVVEEVVASHSARVVGVAFLHTVSGDELTTADLYDYLAEQWALEHPGQSSGAREPVELCVKLVCSLRTWRAVRKGVLKGLCPESTGPHICRVPWSA